MLILVTLHISLSICMGLIGMGRLNPQERFCNFLLSVFYPVGGVLLVLSQYLYRPKTLKEIDDDHEFEKPIILLTDRLNYETETNVLSLEEALALRDPTQKRRQLLEVLKQDSSRYIDKLSIALRDDDAETSHYAASALFELKRTLDLNIQAMAVEVNNGRKDPEFIIGYLKVIKEYLDSGLLDTNSRRRYAGEYASFAQHLIREGYEDSEIFRCLIEALTEIGEADKARGWCDVYLKAYDTEPAYLTSLRFHYSLKDYRSFREVFNRLVKSDVRLSHEGLTIVRFWLEGAQ